MTSKNYTLVPRGCSNPRCSQVFKVLESDKKTTFCSDLCKTSIQGNPLYKDKWNPRDRRLAEIKKRKEEKCQNMEKSEMTVESGPVGGEPQSKSLPEKLAQKAEDQRRNIALKTMKESVSPGRTIPTSAGSPTRDPKQIIMPTKKTESPSESFGLKKISNDNFKPKETTMQETMPTNVEKSTPIASSEILPLDSNHLSTALETERQSSMQSLNIAGEFLLNLAESHAKGLKRDEDGDIVSRPSVASEQVVIKALSEFRNVMNTKLSFMKFGKELASKK